MAVLRFCGSSMISKFFFKCISDLPSWNNRVHKPCLTVNVCNVNFRSYEYLNQSGSITGNCEHCCKEEISNWKFLLLNQAPECGWKSSGGKDPERRRWTTSLCTWATCWRSSSPSPTTSTGLTPTFLRVTPSTVGPVEVPWVLVTRKAFILFRMYPHSPKIIDKYI